jgi:hypothetical protein
MSQTLLSTRSPQACLSLLFPVRLSQNLRHQVTQMSRHDIEVHGSSMTQKLFEITDTIADVLIHVPAPTLEETAYRIEDYLFILDFVLLFPTLDQTRRGILLEKLERLQSKFPEVCSASSSPNMPLGLQSPGVVASDSWYQIAHSRIGADSGAEQMATVGLTLGPFTEQGREQRTGMRREKWNHISRKLSMATFTVPAELEYGT